jgi:hypothetical protein
MVTSVTFDGELVAEQRFTNKARGISSFAASPQESRR